MSKRDDRELPAPPAVASRVLDAGLDPTTFFQKHLVNAAIGATLGAVAALVDHRALRAYAPIVYGASCLGLVVVLSPLLLVLAVLVKTTSTGPVFFRQERVGLNGSTFRMIKFRSMVVDAEERLQELSALDRAEGNDVLFKMRNDPRVTRVGKFLRRYSLDELPQLINVVRGDMSLVGPRPPLASETELYGVDMRRRFLVKPGLTGLWQVSGRSDVDYRQRVALDSQYARNPSLRKDIMLLALTVIVVLRCRGAY